MKKSNSYFFDFLVEYFLISKVESMVLFEKLCKDCIRPTETIYMMNKLSKKLDIDEIGVDLLKTICMYHKKNIVILKELLKILKSLDKKTLILNNKLFIDSFENIEKRKEITKFLLADDQAKKLSKGLYVLIIIGGADGTRTRDPRRDRPVF